MLRHKLGLGRGQVLSPLPIAYRPSPWHIVPTCFATWPEAVKFPFGSERSLSTVVYRSARSSFAEVRSNSGMCQKETFGADHQPPPSALLVGCRIENAGFTKAGVSGTLASGAFWISTSGKAHDVSDRFIYDTTGGQLYYDADGSGGGTAVKIAQLKAGLALTYKDIVVF